MDKQHLNLGAIHPAWEGFIVRDGLIYTPNGYWIKPGDIYAIPLKMQLIEELKRNVATPEQMLL